MSNRGENPKPVRLRSLWLVGVLVGAAAFLLASVLGGAEALEYTSQPEFCNTCHNMTTRYASWKTSTHNPGATCMQCHSEPGRWGEFKAHLNGLRYLYVYYTGKSTGPILRAEVHDATCKECHNPSRLPESARGHLVDHEKHLNLKVGCTTCHEQLVHGTFSGQARKPAMDTCVTCHQEQQPLDVACAVCHPKGLALR